MNELLLPSKTVALLRSKDAGQRIQGILESGRNIDAGKGASYSSSETLELATLPRRLYELIFDSDHRVAREAAFVLVSRARSYNTEFVGIEEYVGAPATIRTVFAKRLVEFLESNGLRFFVNVEAKKSAVGIHLEVDLTRRLPFDIDGVHPLLSKPRVYERNFFNISTPFGLYGSVTNVVLKQLTDVEEAAGYIIRATADVEDPGDPYHDDMFAVTIHYQNSVGTVKVPHVA